MFSLLNQLFRVFLCCPLWNLQLQPVWICLPLLAAVQPTTKLNWRDHLEMQCWTTSQTTILSYSPRYVVSFVAVTVFVRVALKEQNFKMVVLYRTISATRQRLRPPCHPLPHLQYSTNCWTEWLLQRSYPVVRKKKSQQRSQWVNLAHSSMWSSDKL